jgi:hypothetical protein
VLRHVTFPSLAKDKHTFERGAEIGCRHAVRSHQTLTAAQVSVTLISKFVTDQCDLSSSRVLGCGNYPGTDINGLPGTRKHRVLALSIQITYELDERDGKVGFRLNVACTCVYVHWQFTCLHFTYWEMEEKITTFHNYVCVSDRLN